MRFKVIGVILLIVAAWFAVEGVIQAERQNNEAISATVFPLVAIFMAMVVRVLQAEKHHRDRLKMEERIDDDVRDMEHTLREELSVRR
jgi:type VI protein secretion system component VasK